MAKRTRRCKHWLQRNRIDVSGVCRSMASENRSYERKHGVMKQIELTELAGLTLHPCQRCGDAMRLIGSEPHPVEAKTDLLTYCCEACEEFFVQPIAHAAI